MIQMHILLKHDIYITTSQTPRIYNVHNLDNSFLFSRTRNHVIVTPEISHTYNFAKTNKESSKKMSDNNNMSC